MLVLTRKKNQSIMIGDNIVITVLETRDDAVSIGIAAPKSITVLRSELYEDVKRENMSVLTNDMASALAIKNLLKTEKSPKE
ncbi:carbon storage regulator CsrA [Desulfotruncus alcoholivorax]|uniref:carbon storage regulator CsrA n=1 Tax=Desulfotruncus alcoholivorax TaxID=265477 RepID=UPI00040D0E66|nr:carbon storage regulator CsrA [Desulfotruncus alcoholivorax]